MSACIKILKQNEFKTIPVRQGTDILFNKRIADILDYDRTSNTYSYTIDIPETNEVNKVIEWASDLTQDSPYRGTTVEAILESSGIPLKGFLKITGHSGRYYQAQFISGTFNWWLEVSTLKIKDLGFDEEYVLDSAGTIAGVFAPGGTGVDDTAGYVDAGPPVWASLKCFGKWKSTFVYANEMQLDVYAMAIVYKLFQNSAYKLKSNFFNSSFFRKVLLWLAPPALDKEPSFFYSGGQSLTDPTLAFTTLLHTVDPDGNLNSYDTGTGTYLTPANGNYKITIDYDILVTGTTASDLIVQFFKDTSSPGDALAPAIYVPLNTPTSGSFSISVPYSGGVNTTIIVGALFSDPMGQSPDVSVTITTKFRIEYDADVVDYTEVENITIKAKEFIKADYTVADFLRAMIHKFNLQVEVDVASQMVTIEPYNDYYYNNAVYEDWSELVNCDTIKTSFQNEVKRTTVFKFKDDGKDKNTKDLYAYTHNALKRYVEGVNTSTCPMLSPTINFSDEVISTTSAYIPKIWNGDADSTGTYPDRSFDFNARIFYKLGFKEYAGEDWKWLNNTNVLTRIPKALQVGQGAHLGFNDSLFADYYAAFFQDMENADKIEVEVALDFQKFSVLDFRLPKLIKRGGANMFYRLLSADDFDANEKTLTACTLQVWKK